MKRKLLFVACAVLTSVCAWAQSWTGGESTKVYLKNVGSNLFWGAANTWGTQASLVNENQYVKLIANGDGTYKMESLVSNGSGRIYFSGSYMDSDSPASLTITSLGSGKYSIANGPDYYGWDGSSTVLATAADASSENFQWVGYTQDEIDKLNATALSAATNASPVDATCLILDPKFGRNRTDASTVWSITASNKTLNGGGQDGGCAESYKSTFDLSQSLSKAPNGKYKLTAQAFCRVEEGTADKLPYIFISNGTDTQKSDFKLRSGTENDMATAATSFKNGLYQLDDIYIVKADGQSLSVGARLEEETNLWSIWANFQLTYYGNAVEVYSPAPFTSNTSATADTWYELSGVSAGWYRISSTAAATLNYTQDNSDYADATASKTFTAGGNTIINLSEGSFYFKSDATSTIKIEAISSSDLQNGDVVTDVFIANPSFETGDLSGWTNQSNAFSIKSESHLGNKVGTYYAFVNNNNTRSLSQTVSHLPEGNYVLSVNAKIVHSNTSYGTSTINMGSNSTPIPCDLDAATYYVAYEASDDASASISFSKNGVYGYRYFDNFTLTYYTELPAISGVDDLLAEPMAGDVRAALVTANTNYTGSKTVAYYNALQTAIVNAKTSIAAFAVNTGANADWTSAIQNPSFETGNYNGWTTTASNDTGAKLNSNGTYTMSDVDGSYLFNTWSTGYTISQTLKNLPAGNYKLTAVMGTDAGATFRLGMGGNIGFAPSSESGKGTGVSVTVYAKLATDGDLTISADAGGSMWYKVDNFQLTYDPTLPENVTAVEGKMNSTVASTQTSAVAAYNATSGQTIDNMIAAQAAIYAAHLSKQVYTEIDAIKTNYDTKAAALDATGQAAYAAGTSATQYTNGTYETASEAETAYHNDYIAAVKAQDTDNAVYTDVIVNPSFEDGKTGWGWYSASGQSNWQDNNKLVSGRLVEGGGDQYLGFWTNCATGSKVRQTINLPAGSYKLSAYLKPKTAGDVLTLSAKDQTTSITTTDTKPFLCEVSFSIESTQDVEISAGTTTSEGEYWMDDFQLILTASYYANAADYTALNAAIAAGDAKTLGFEDGEYAPYSNIDALTALAAAKAIDQMASNTKASVQTATTTLTDAWVPNVGNVECVYNGDFSKGDWGFEGWSRPESWGKNLPSDVEGLTTEILKAAGSSTGSAYYNQPGSLVYGSTDLYTMPLKANTIYTLTFKYASWEPNSNNSVTASVLKASDGMAAKTFDANKTIYTAASAFVTRTIKFVTGAAGDYVLTLVNDGNTVITDVSITKDASQRLVISDTDAEAGWAPGTYNVALTRTLSASYWSTFSVPFNAAIPSGWTVKEFNSATGNTLNFANASTIEAGKPYLVKPASNVVNPTFDNVTVVSTEGVTMGEGDYKFAAQIYNKELATNGTSTIAYLSTTTDAYGQVIKKLTSGGGIKGLRAYFIVPASGAGARIHFMEENETTGIESIDNGQLTIDNGAVYDLQGRKVQNLKRGMYIINGKKVVVK